MSEIPAFPRLSEQRFAFKRAFGLDRFPVRANPDGYSSTVDHWEEQSFPGLERRLRYSFPIVSPDRQSELTYRTYELQARIPEEIQCSLEYPVAAELRVVVELFGYEPEDVDGNRSVRDIKQQELWFGMLPLQTERGTFLRWGAEKLLRSHLEEAAGIWIDQTEQGNTSLRVVSLDGGTLVLSLRDERFCLEIHSPKELEQDAWVAWKPPQRTLYLTDTGVPSLSYEGDVSLGVTLRNAVRSSTGTVLASKGERLTPELFDRFRTEGVTGLPLSERDLSSLAPLGFAFDENDQPCTTERVGPLEQKNLEALAKKGIRKIPVQWTREPPPTASTYCFDDEQSCVEWFVGSVEELLVGPAFDERLKETLEKASFEQFFHASVFWGLLRWLKENQGAAVSVSPPRPKRLVTAADRILRFLRAGLRTMQQQSLHAMLRVKEPDYVMPHDLVAYEFAAKALDRVWDAMETPSCSTPMGLAVLVEVPEDEPLSKEQSVWVDALPLETPDLSQNPGLLERAAPAVLGHLLQATTSGVVVCIDEESIVVLEAGPWPCTLKTYTRNVFRSGSSGFSTMEQVLVSVGDTVEVGTALAASSFVQNGVFSLGKNLRVSVVEGPLKATLSSSVAEQGAFRTKRTMLFELQGRDEDGAAFELTNAPPGVPSGWCSLLDQEGIVFDGAQVEKGMLLVGAQGWAAKTKKPVSLEKQDASLRAPAAGTVTSVQLLTRAGLDRTAREEKQLEAREEQQRKREEILHAALKERFSKEQGRDEWELQQALDAVTAQLFETRRQREKASETLRFDKHVRWIVRVALDVRDETNGIPKTIALRSGARFPVKLQESGEVLAPTIDGYEPDVELSFPGGLAAFCSEFGDELSEGRGYFLRVE